MGFRIYYFVFSLFILTILIQPQFAIAGEQEDLDRCLDRWAYCESRCISGIICYYPECIVQYACEEEYVNELKENLGLIEEKEIIGGDCLIATASYGSELAPQVQMLREIRDNSLLQTNSGSAFMESFNSIYYTFAPTIAQWENESPVFKEIVRTTITPLIASLSLLQYVSMDTDAEVLFYGISMIVLNLGMYFVAPAIIVWKLKK